MERKPITPWGYRHIEKELQRLRSVERPANIRAIEEARAHGDLSENAEYKYAKEQQSFIVGREKEMESLLAVAEVIDPAKLSGERIVFGATCTLLDLDTEEECLYTIVGDAESAPEKGRISISSPIARALIGHSIGDECIVKAPKGKRVFEVLDVEFFPCTDWD